MEEMLNTLFSILGPFALGVVVGYVVHLFIKATLARSLATVIAVMVGGLVSDVFKQPTSSTFWLYCIGLAGGVIVLPLLLSLLHNLLKDGGGAQ